MARHDESKELRAQVLQELREAIKKYGLDAAPKIVRERYPDVPRPTWYRWLKDVAASPMDQAIDKAIKVAKKLPAAPSPAYLAERPIEARRNIDFMTRLEDLYSDAELLRAYAITKGYDVDGNEVTRIKIPQFFAQSIKLRSDLLDNAVRTIQQLYDLKRQQDQFDQIMNAIMEESPETAARITERLTRLNAEMGMTIDARI